MPTLGNLGSAKNLCSFQQISIDHPLHLGCKKGEIKELEFHGLLPEEIHPHSYQFDYCGNPE
jgi:hypothetical protein